MNSILPTGLSKTLEENIIHQLSPDDSKSSTDKKIVKILKDSPENMIDFLEVCLKDKKYLQDHEELMEKLFKRFDKDFVENKFTPEQQKTILKLIKCDPFALSHIPCFYFIRGSERIPVPRMMLFPESQYFKVQATSGLKKNQDELHVEEISSPTLDAIQHYLNAGVLPKIDDANVIQEIISQADQWGMTGLLQALTKSCTFSKENVIPIYQAAQLYSLPELEKNAWDFLDSQSYEIEEIVYLYQHSTVENLPDISRFCVGRLLQILGDSEAKSAEEKNKKETYSQSQIREIIYPLLNHISNFSKEDLAKLPCSQLVEILKSFL